MEIRICARELEGRVLAAGEHLTGVLDQLNLLEAEAKGIRPFWDGPASRAWCRELDAKIGRVAMSIRKLNRLLMAMNEIAAMLAETEKNNDMSAMAL